jgi:hypothetical protein
MLKSRFWRLYITAQVGYDGYINLSQIALRATPGGVNQCIGSGGTANQSSAYYPTLDAIYAFEEASLTGGGFWHSASQSAPWWASFDFGPGVYVSVAELAITGTNIAGREPRDFSLQFSSDGIRWYNAASFIGITAWTLNVSQAFTIPLLA